MPYIRQRLMIFTIGFLSYKVGLLIQQFRAVPGTAVPAVPGQFRGQFRGQYIELFGILFRSWLLWPESPIKQDLDIINKCLLTKWSARPLMFAERGHFILG